MSIVQIVIECLDLDIMLRMVSDQSHKTKNLFDFSFRFILLTQKYVFFDKFHFSDCIAKKTREFSSIEMLQSVFSFCFFLPSYLL